MSEWRDETRGTRCDLEVDGMIVIVWDVVSQACSDWVVLGLDRFWTRCWNFRFSAKGRELVDRLRLHKDCAPWGLLFWMSTVSLSLEEPTVCSGLVTRGLLLRLYW